MIAELESVDVVGLGGDLMDELAAAIRERDLLKAALSLLVAAKDEKDLNGETAKYRELKAGAWDGAREVLAQIA